MCGICGFNWEEPELLRRMKKAIVHRGPEGHGQYADSRVSLGHLRLKIIDLSERGSQPMTNEDGSIVIIYNGELYNFQELRVKLERKGHRFNSDTDTEVIIHAYEEFGPDCLHYFNGMFAFCIYDTRKNLLFLARDRIGIKPLYYYIKDKKFIFASEIKAILEHPLKREVHTGVLNNYFALRYVCSEDTIFQSIKRLKPGHYMLYGLGNRKLQIKQYWDIQVTKSDLLHKSEQFFVDRLGELLEDSVKRRLISDVPLGAFLSGGLDSSGMVALMSKINKDNEQDAAVKTFSVGFEMGEHVNELTYAAQVGELFETDHNEFMLKPGIIKHLPKIVWHLDEPMADPALLPLFYLSAQAKKKVTVVLTGDGGDETFAGYDHYKFLSWWKKIRQLPAFVPDHLIPGVMENTPSALLDRIYKMSSAMGEEANARFKRFMRTRRVGEAYYELLSVFDEHERKEFLGRDYFKKKKYAVLEAKFFSDHHRFLNRLLYFDFKRMLAESFLMKTDRATMAYAVEARVPILDHTITEFAFKIPARFKLRGTNTKYIFKKTLQTLLPKQIMNRRKQVFHVPIENWMAKYIKDLSDSFLSEKELKKTGYFKPYYVKKLMANYKKSKLVYAKQLWSILNFQIWHKLYIERQKIRTL